MQREGSYFIEGQVKVTNLQNKNIWAEKRPGGVFLRLNNKKTGNYGESLFLESLEGKTKKVRVCCNL